MKLVIEFSKGSRVLRDRRGQLLECGELREDEKEMSLLNWFVFSSFATLRLVIRNYLFCFPFAAACGITSELKIQGFNCGNIVDSAGWFKFRLRDVFDREQVFLTVLIKCHDKFKVVVAGAI